MPVKPDGLPEPQVLQVDLATNRERFTLPKKLICMNASGSYTAETHQVRLVKMVSFAFSIQTDRLPKTIISEMIGIS